MTTKTPQTVGDVIQRFTVLSESPVTALNSPYTGNWVKYADHEVIVSLLHKELKKAIRERDLAVAHDRQPYPTAWAYDQVCKALESTKVGYLALQDQVKSLTARFSAADEQAKVKP